MVKLQRGNRSINSNLVITSFRFGMVKLQPSQFGHRGALFCSFRFGMVKLQHLDLIINKEEEKSFRFGMVKLQHDATDAHYGIHGASFRFGMVKLQRMLQRR